MIRNSLNFTPLKWGFKLLLKWARGVANFQSDLERPWLIHNPTKRIRIHLSVFRKMDFTLIATSEVSHYFNLQKKPKYNGNLLVCHFGIPGGLNNGASFWQPSGMSPWQPPPSCICILALFGGCINDRFQRLQSRENWLMNPDFFF